VAVLERPGAVLGLLLSLVAPVAQREPAPPAPPAPPAFAPPAAGVPAQPGALGAAPAAGVPGAGVPGAGVGPVEILEQRGEATTAYRHPDGARTIVLSAGPIRLRHNGQWEPLDLTLRRDPDGGIRPVAHPDTLWLAGGGKPADAAAVRGADGTNTALPWDGPLPAPRLDGNRAVYRNARPGADLVIEVTRTGFVATLESAGGATREVPRAAPHAPTAPHVPAAPHAPTPAQPAPAPAVAQSAPAPAVAQSVPAPAVEPAPAVATAPVAPPITPLTLRVTHPGPATDSAPSAPELMTGPAGTLAARAVLSRVVASASEGLTLPFDTTVQNTAGTTDLSGDPDLKLGSYDGRTVARAFLSWDLSGLRDQRVMSAALRLYSNWSASCQASGWEVWSSPPIGPATRWTSQPAGDRAWATSTDTRGHDAHCQPGWTSVDVTDLVRGWVLAGAGSGTVLVRATNELDPLSWKRFSSGAGANLPALGVTVAP